VYCCDRLIRDDMPFSPTGIRPAGLRISKPLTFEGKMGIKLFCGYKILVNKITCNGLGAYYFILMI
jgi:hypothetical protein